MDGPVTSVLWRALPWETKHVRCQDLERKVRELTAHLEVMTQQLDEARNQLLRYEEAELRAEDEARTKAASAVHSATMIGRTG